jgi:16S rRNA (cytosine967-C5)-methyltransferase
MTPAARVAAAIEILDCWRAGSDGLDRVLAAWGRANRYAGSGDRRAIADLVYDTVRRMRSAAWVAGVEEPASGRSLLQGCLLLDGIDPGEFFTGMRHAPEVLGPEEQRDRSLPDAPAAVRNDLPDWLWAEMNALGGEVLDALRGRAPVDLRVNTLKTDRTVALDVLAKDGIVCEPLDLSPTALRVREGARRVAGSRAYTGGLIEIQDVASQAVADLAGALPGEVVLDLCAGGGGKSLALAAAMENKGHLIAHDVAPARMKGLPDRASRAGAKIELAELGALEQFIGKCDLVFVDAPCSGSGAWRRNPDAKWALTPARLEQLEATQAALLAQAAELCAPGGRIAYATCSLIEKENREQIASFLAVSPAWEGHSSLSVHPPDGDGFFAQVVRKIGVSPES